MQRASIPENWPRVWPNERYWTCYTLNDNVLANVVSTLFEAERVGKLPNAGTHLRELGIKAREAAEKAGDFLVLAQLPEPQAAWAQQYDAAMHPVWVRKFEPPAVTGGESQSAIKLLLDLYRHTGRRNYLEPVPRALAYLRRSRLPDGRLARFYEFRSNKALYFTQDYVLTYDDANAPTHYSFKVSDGTDALTREYERLAKSEPTREQPEGKTPKAASPDLLRQVEKIIADQDTQGRWIDEGGLRYHQPKNASVRVIRTATFIHHVETLSRFIASPAGH